MDQVIIRIASLGFQGVETYDLAEFLEDATLTERVIAAFAQTHLSLAGTFFGASLVEPERLASEEEFLRKNCRRVHELGGEFIVVGGGKLRHNSELFDRPQLYDAVNRLGDVALAEGVHLAFHPHAGTLIYTPEEIERFAQKTDPQSVWFAFDAAHLKCGGGDPAKLFARYLSRIAYVHFKDSRAGIFCELGEGEVDLVAVYSVLRDSGFDGWVIVELDEPEDAERSALINLRYLQDKLGVLRPTPGTEEEPRA